MYYIQAIDTNHISSFRHHPHSESVVIRYVSTVYIVITTVNLSITNGQVLQMSLSLQTCYLWLSHTLCSQMQPAGCYALKAMLLSNHQCLQYCCVIIFAVTHKQIDSFGFFLFFFFRRCIIYDEYLLLCLDWNEMNYAAWNWRNSIWQYKWIKQLLKACVNP